MKRVSVFAFLVSASVHAASADLNLNPRLEGIAGRAGPQAARGLLKADAGANFGDFRLRASGFGEADALTTQPQKRRSRFYATPEEAFLEFRADILLIRAGLQAVRWSESWTTPSLDVWTARRWNRLFFDPMTEQLVHPTGLLLSLADSNFEITGFGAIFPAADMFPKPMANPERWHRDLQGGGRFKARIEGVDVGGVFAHRTAGNSFGGSASYAFDSCVPKLEGGSLDDDLLRFLTLGIDFFVGTWSILPQYTLVQTPLAGREHLGYLPVRYTSGDHSFEFQYFFAWQERSAFAGGVYSYNLAEALKLSVFLQDYRGSSGLFELYREMTGGYVGGLRLEGFVSL